MDFETPLISLYIAVDDWWKEHRPTARRGPGRPVTLSDGEVLTLAILSQWPRLRSERDFYRFAGAHLRAFFPNLLSQSQLNRRICALEPELKALQRDLVETLTDGSEVYHVVDTTLIPAMVTVRACRKIPQGCDSSWRKLPNKANLCRLSCLLSMPQRRPRQWTRQCA